MNAHVQYFIVKRDILAVIGMHLVDSNCQPSERCISLYATSQPNLPKMLHTPAELSQDFASSLLEPLVVNHRQLVIHFLACTPG